MAYADITVNDPNPLKRWIQRRRFTDALAVLRELAVVPAFDVLDFGGGDGELIRQAVQIHPGLRATLYEPTPALRNQARSRLQPSEVQIVGDLRELGGRQFDLVFCLEVFEHLPVEETDKAIDEIYRLVKPDGRVVIGVPHELFLPALFKGAFRMARRYGTFDAVPSNVLRATVGYPPTDRPRRDISPGFSYHYYHTGFDYRSLERSLQRRFTIVSRWFSPVRSLGFFLNSEVYYLIQPVGL